MSKEQIKEIAHILASDCGDCKKCAHFHKEVDGIDSCYYRYAEMVYNAVCRKQSEGEWVKSDIPQEKYVCSACGGACWYYDFKGDVAKSRFCPNCGARMKGGAE